MPSFLSKSTWLAEPNLPFLRSQRGCGKALTSSTGENSSVGSTVVPTGTSTIRPSDLTDHAYEHEDAQPQDSPSNRYEDTSQASLLKRGTGFRQQVDATIERYRLFATGDLPLSHPDLTSWTYRSAVAEPTISTALSMDTKKLEMPNFVRLMVFAHDHVMKITAGLEKSGHNTGSAHYVGNAIDVRTTGVNRETVNQFMLDATNAGLSVRDERKKPEGQKKWGGPHIHLEVPTKARPMYILVSPAFYSTPPPGTRVREPESANSSKVSSRR
jgi:hypothetical protein